MAAGPVCRPPGSELHVVGLVAFKLFSEELQGPSRLQGLLQARSRAGSLLPRFNQNTSTFLCLIQ